MPISHRVAEAVGRHPAGRHSAMPVIRTHGVLLHLCDI